jgi:dUTP pyrophosphatase
MNTLYIKNVNDEDSVYFGPYSNGVTNYTDDSGYDLYCPEELVVPAKAVSFKVDLKIQTMMEDVEGNNVGYTLLPRSSMGAKTPLRLCNSIGVIDASYRGNLMMFVDNVSDQEYTIRVGDRLSQAVCFNGKPIVSMVVKELNETDRGVCGFGSTGK